MDQNYSKQFINGEFVEGRGKSTLQNLNPYTGQVIYEYRSASAEDVDQAYRAAKVAQPAWEALTPGKRVAYFERLLEAMRTTQDEMREILATECGSSVNKQEFEMGIIQDLALEAMSYPARMHGSIVPSNIPGKVNYIYRRPRGVISVIAPWNMPFLLSMKSVLPALATGNTVVLKPSSETPSTALYAAKLFDMAGFPKGVFNVIVGRGSEIGDSFTQHPIPDLISFTGSTEVGKHIGQIAGEQIKEVSLELGGNCVMIVLDDADLDQAVEAGMFGAFFNAGQACMRVNRFIIMDAVYEEFKNKLVEAVKQIKVGDPTDPNSYYSTVISQDQIDKIQGLIDGSIQQGAKVELQGSTEGLVMQPWILGECSNTMPTAAEEVFGPVATLIRVQDIQEAIQVANETEYGLSGSVFTRDAYKGIQVASQVKSGMMHVNDQSVNDEPHVMFGGEKESGIGRFNGHWVLEKFTTERLISVQEKPRF